MYTKIPTEILMACDFFQENKTNSQKSFTDINTANLDYDRLFNGVSTFWETKKPAEEYQKRLIVITDWSSELKEDTQNQIVILSLINHGFEIYLWTGEPIRIESAYTLETTIKHIVPVHPRIVEKYFAEKEIEKNRVKILDYFERRYVFTLINHGKKIEPYLDYRDLENNNFNPDCLLNSFLEDCEFTLKIGIWGIGNVTFFNKCLSMPQVKSFAFSMMNIKYMNESLIKLYEKTGHRIKKAYFFIPTGTVNNPFFKELNKFNNLGQLYIYSEETIDIHLSDSALKILSLKGPIAIQNPLNQLKKLELIHNNKYFFVNTKNLEYLTVHGKVHESILNNTMQFPRLKSLTFIENSDLLQIMNNKFHYLEVLCLKKLDLIHISQHADISEYTRTLSNIIGIKKITIQDSSLPWFFVECLLRNNQQLKELVLDGYLYIYHNENMKKLEGFLNKLDFLPTTLESVTLTIKNNIPSTEEEVLAGNLFLKIILDRCVNIKVIELSLVNQKCFNEIKYLDVFYLKNDQLRMQRMNPSHDHLKRLLSHSSQLNAISLRDFKEDSLHKLSKTHEAGLRALTFSNNSSPFQISQLKKYPKLEAFLLDSVQLTNRSLIVHGAIDFSVLLELLENPLFNTDRLLLTHKARLLSKDNEQLENIMLPRLKSIIIEYGAHISQQQAQLLQTNASHLKELNVNQLFAWVSSNIHLEKIIMSGFPIIPKACSLTHLVLNEADFDEYIEPLMIHIKNSPNLKVLKLFGEIAEYNTIKLLNLIARLKLPMHKLMINDVFVFKNGVLKYTLPIPRCENFIYDLFGKASNWKAVHITQPINIKKLLGSKCYGQLQNLSLVSYMGDNEVLSLTFDKLLEQCPNLEYITANLYTNTAYFIITEQKYHKFQLETTESLTTEQINKYVKHNNVTSLTFHSLLNDFIWNIKNTCVEKIHINDTESLLKNMAAFQDNTHIQIDFFSPYFTLLASPNFFRQHLKFDGDKVHKLPAIENLSNIRMLTIYNSLHADMVSQFINHQINELNLINIDTHDDQVIHLITYLMNELDCSITVQTRDLQLLFSIHRANDSLILRGYYFNTDLMHEIITKKSGLIRDIYFDSFNFTPDFKLPLKIKTRDINFHFKNSNVEMPFIYSLIPYFKRQNYSGKIYIDNCSHLKKWQLKDFIATFPDICIYSDDYNYDCDEQEESSNSYEESAPSSEDDSCAAIHDLRQYIDKNTGTQDLGDNDEDNHQYFQPKPNQDPVPNYFRLSVKHLDDFESDIKIIKQVSLAADKNTVLKSYNHANPDHFFADITFSLNKNVWSPLPSLTPEDQLIQFYSSEPVTLGYSKQDNLFYMLSSKTINRVQVSFIIRADLSIHHADEEKSKNYIVYYPSIQQQAKKNPVLSAQFNAIKQWKNREKQKIIIEFCAGFSIAELSKTSTNKDELLNIIIDERKGVCRHRTVVFMELAKRLGVRNVRAIRNEIHAFVEVKHQGKWQMICLGGPESPQPKQILEEHIYVINPQDKAKRPVITIEEEQSADLDYHVDSSELSAVVLSNEISMDPKSSFDLTGNQSDIEFGINPQQFQCLTKPKDLTYIHALNPFNHPKKTPMLLAADFPNLCKHVMSIADTLSNAAKKLFLNFQSPNQIEQFHAAMAAFITESHGEYLYIPSLKNFLPKELIIDPITKQFTTQPHRILTATTQAQKGDVLVVNISDYDGEIVSDINALTDKQSRKLANQNLSDHVTIIIVKLHTTRVSEDLTTRFSEKARYTVPQLPEVDLLAPFCKQSEPDIDIPYIDFYNGDYWKKQMVGTVKLQDLSMDFEKGWLIQMIENHQSQVGFYNPPWEMEEFRLFILSFYYTKKCYSNGNVFTLPPNFIINVSNKTYDLASSDYRYHLEGYDAEKIYEYVLNNTNYYLFFNSYQTQNQHLVQNPGWLTPHSQLSVLVTESIAEPLWARLLETARLQQCEMILIFAPNIQLPTSMQTRAKNLIHTPLALNKNRLIVSNDGDFSTRLLCDNTPSVSVFSVNMNTPFSDLFESINIENSGQDLRVGWQSAPVRDALLIADNTVILKGCISQEIAHKIQTLFIKTPYLFINGEKEYYPGQLILITEDNPGIKNTVVEKEYYTKEDYYAFLAKTYDLEPLKSQYEHLQAINNTINFNFKTLEKIYELHRMNSVIRSAPEITSASGAKLDTILTCSDLMQETEVISSAILNPFLPFLALHPEYLQFKTKIAPVIQPEFKTSDDFNMHRAKGVADLFACSPFIFLVGASGVGKSTFVKTQFTENHVFTGLDYLESWARQGGIFFLDETNLYSKGSLDFFEGLFNNFPGILYNKTFYPITEKHRIIFAGNYTHYANRHLHAFLKQVPAVEFVDFPDFYLQDLVKNALNKTMLSYDNAIISIFIKVYQHVNRVSPNAGWTTRNLENMVLRYSVFRIASGITSASGAILNQSTEANAWLAAYDEIDNNNGEAIIVDLQTWVEQQFPAIQSIINTLNASFSITKPHFILTDCRKNIFRLIQDQIKIQCLKESNPQLQCLGGVSGFLLEGESGIGKSVMAIEALESLGYFNGDQATSKQQKVYYFISQSDNMVAHLDKKTTLTPIEVRLTKAFHEGAIVVIDEFNTFDLEKIMNALMSGVDLSGKPAIKPGFFAFLTGNPITYIGRKALPAPIKNRIFFKQLPEYSKLGIKQIAHARLPHTIARPLAFFFNHRKASNTRDFTNTIDNVKNDCFGLLPDSFLMNLYSLLDTPDQSALQCTSLMNLVIFANLYSPTLFDDLKTRVIMEDPVLSIIKSSESEDDTDSISSEDSSSEYEEDIDIVASDKHEFEIKNSVIINTHNEIDEAIIHLPQTTSDFNPSLANVGLGLSIVGGIAGIVGLSIASCGLAMPISLALLIVGYVITILGAALGIGIGIPCIFVANEHLTLH